MMPVRMCFGYKAVCDRDPSAFYWEMMIDFLFIFDIAINFSTVSPSPFLALPRALPFFFSSFYCYFLVV